MPSNAPRAFGFILLCLVVIGAVAWLSPVGTAVADKDLVPGVVVKIYQMEKSVRQIPDVPKRLPQVSKVMSTIDIDDGRKGYDGLEDHLLLVAFGYLKIEQGGTYGFRLSSDDGSRFFINGKTVIDNDGPRRKNPGEQKVPLRAGTYSIRVDHVEVGGKAYVKLEWQRPKSDKWEIVPADVLFSKADEKHRVAEIPKEKKKDPPKPPKKKPEPKEEPIVDPLRPALEELKHDEAIGYAIEDGTTYLLKEVERQQFAVTDRNQEGQVALETYALVVAGVSIEHPLIEENFEYLAKTVVSKGNTYALGCYVMALDAAIAQLEYDLLLGISAEKREKYIDNPGIGRRFRTNLAEATERLLEGQNGTGGWRYYPTNNDADSSCTQFAALALGVAAKRRLTIESGVWTRMASYFMDLQDQDGALTEKRCTPYPEGESARKGLKRKHLTRNDKRKGRNKDKDKGRGGSKTEVIDPIDPAPFIGSEEIDVKVRGYSYNSGQNAKWNMTCAGLSSMLLAEQYVGAELPEAARNEVHASIRDGFGWMMEKWTPTETYYGIYSLEKVADIGGVKKFAEHDWYDVVSKFLLEKQEKSGRWKGTGHHGENDRVATSFALLVLNRATTMLTMNPAHRVLATGPGSENLGQELGREWVYIPDMETCVYYPQLLRTMRLRPNPALVKMLPKICASYEESYRPELIPHYLKVRQSVTSSGVKRVVDRCLKTITGKQRKLKTDDDYMAYRERWAQIINLVEDEKVDAKTILAAYEKTGDDLNKRLLIQCIVRRAFKEAIPHLSQDLDNGAKNVRRDAYRALQTMFIEPLPPFDPSGDDGEREKQIAAVRQWLEAQGAKTSQ